LHAWFHQKLDSLEQGRRKNKLNTVFKRDLLRPKVDNAVNKLQLQASKLDGMIAKVTEKEGMLFKRIVNAIQKHDADSAKAFSNELAEVRKISRMLNQTKMALEQVSLRLTTVTDMGDVMVALGPAISSVKGLKSRLGKFVPGADNEIGSIQTVLEGAMGSLNGGGSGINVSSGSDAEIDQIMKEASAVAEHRVNEGLLQLAKLNKDEAPQAPSLNFYTH
jgi:division protein CdvB (Snf7/Vps24/ESCRT-III family)